jgi:hypothetical protein
MSSFEPAGFGEFFFADDDEAALLEAGAALADAFPDATAETDGFTIGAVSTGKTALAICAVACGMVVAGDADSVAVLFGDALLRDFIVAKAPPARSSAATPTKIHARFLLGGSPGIVEWVAPIVPGSSPLGPDAGPEMRGLETRAKFCAAC